MAKRTNDRPTTLGALRASGWTSRPVKEEIRANAVARISAGEPSSTGVLGYEDTVLPQLENALLAGHDMIFLGERGQAKTRMIRSLVEPARRVDADRRRQRDQRRPLRPHLASTARDWSPSGGTTRRSSGCTATPLRREAGDARHSIADLIGEVDPIKVAEGRYLSDELTMHYGLVPRTNRGIFAINELPDLAERIQVGLLNVLEERDVQIRGYKIRLPLDVVLVASANPEDYTNRGRIITPLKDRFGAQIRTHYPLDVETELAVVDQEARPFEADGVRVRCPTTWPRSWPISQLARRSPHVNQRSGVSVRLSIANHETLVANAVRRALRLGETEVVPRVSDLDALAASTAGKVEIESLEDGREGQVVERIMKAAVLEVFKARCRPGATPRWSARSRGPRRSTRARTSAVGRRRAVVERPGLGQTLGDLERRRDAGRHRLRHRVRPRGPAPLQAPQQGRRRRPRDLPRPAAEHTARRAASGAAHAQRGVRGRLASAVRLKKPSCASKPGHPLVVVDAAARTSPVDAVADRRGRPRPTRAERARRRRPDAVDGGAGPAGQRGCEPGQRGLAQALGPERR